MDRRRKFILYGALAAAGAGAVVTLLAVRSQDEAELRKLALAAAARHGLDPALVEAVVRAESRFNPRAVSRSGAYGLMQLTVPTAEELAGRRLYGQDLFDPELNLDLGCLYLKRLLRGYSGDLRLALMAYNAGPGRVAQWRAKEPDPDAILRSLAFAETRAYVEKVLGYMGR